VTLKVWPEAKLPEKVEKVSTFEVKTEYFDYSSDDRHFDWYLNFADPDLFGFYNTTLMAQDELQVFECPILAHLRNKLLSLDFYPVVTDDQNRPTPATVKGAYRVCCVDIRPDDQGYSIYGNAFSHASEETIKERVSPIVPPVKCNILAIASISGRKGFYTQKQITDILITAYTGFYAAALESDDALKPRINSGFWGCGAFGGNKTLMTILQLVAASLAGVELRYWTGDAAGANVAKEAYATFQDLFTESRNTRDIIDKLVAMKFNWGVSDGN